MYRLLPFALLLLVLTTACRFKLDDRPNWDTDLTAPLLKSRISLEDALGDSSNIQVNGDNTLTVVYRDTLVNLALSDYLVVPDTSFAAKITLQTIALATDTLTQDITLGQIARQLRDQGNAFGQVLLDNHGQTLFFFPGITNISSDDVPIDASSFFDEADLLTGMMVVEIENHLKVKIDAVTFHLRNAGLLTDTLVRKSMIDILPNTLAVDSADLAGKTVESQMAAKLEDIDVASGVNVPIDTNDYIRLRIIVKNLTASRATAVFPAQNVIDDYSRINYVFGNDLTITRLRAASGELRLDAFSTIQDTIAFTYTLPTAIQNGQPVVVRDRLVPDLATNTAEAHILFALDGYYIDLTLNGDSVNLFPYHLLGQLLYSGRKNTMDLDDSIDVTYGLYDIIPSYIEGYLGTATFSFADTLDLGFFNGVLGGYLNLSNPKVDLTIVNSIGVDGELVVNRMDAVNSRTGTTVAMNADFTNHPTEVRGPKLPNVGQEIVSRINLNRNNSNISEFISNLPDRIEFDMDVFVNKYGNPALKDNFATDQSRLAAFLDIEVPLEGVAEALILQDTVALDLSEATLPDGIKEGTLKLVIDNYFPMLAKVQIYFENTPGMVIDSLFAYGGEFVNPGIVNPSGYVDVPGHTVLSTFFNDERLKNLRDYAHSAVVRFSLSTRPGYQAVKLYTTYGIDFHIVGDFKYSVGLK
jgi:hypothetical protein